MCPVARMTLGTWDAEKFRMARWHAGLTTAQLAPAVGYRVSHRSAVLAGAVPVTEPARWSKALHVARSAVTTAREPARSRQLWDAP